MANLRANTISGIGTQGAILEGNPKFTSSNYFYPPKGTTAERPSNPTSGYLRFNTDSQKLEFYDGSQWVEMRTESSDLNGGARGVFGGGLNPTTTFNVIQYITISTTGNALDFGDLTYAGWAQGAFSSSTRGIWGGGINPSLPAPTNINIIEYVTISSTGNSIDFGDLTSARQYPASVSNSTRGVIAGGASPGNTNIIDYVTIAQTGNAVDFGDLLSTSYAHASCSSPTRGVFAGGFSPSAPTTTNTIQFITIATTGNAQDFGDLTVVRQYLGGCSNSTRGLFGGGVNSNVIDFITIATTGNAADFGDLTLARQEIGSVSSSIRGVWAGAWSPATTNIIDYVTIETRGNAADFGDLTSNMLLQEAGFSNAHGGL